MALRILGAPGRAGPPQEGFAPMPIRSEADIESLRDWANAAGEQFSSTADQLRTIAFAFRFVRWYPREIESIYLRPLHLPQNDASTWEPDPYAQRLAQAALSRAFEAAIDALARKATQQGVDARPLRFVRVYCIDNARSLLWDAKRRADYLGFDIAAQPSNAQAALQAAEDCLYALDISLGLAGAGDDDDRDAGRASRAIGFSVGDLCVRAGVSDGTISKYARIAGVVTPNRGGRNHRYSQADAVTILNAIVDANTNKQATQKCRQSLADIQRETGKKPENQK